MPWKLCKKCKYFLTCRRLLALLNTEIFCTREENIKVKAEDYNENTMYDASSYHKNPDEIVSEVNERISCEFFKKK